MQPVPNIRPISDIRNKHDDVLSDADQGPVILASRSTPKAVLVNVDEWNEISSQMADLRQAVKALTIALKAERKNSQHYSLDEILEMGPQTKVAA